MTELTVASFNAHWGIGYGRSFGRTFDVAATVANFDADVVVLAEAWRPHTGPCALDELAAAGYRVEELRFATMRHTWRPAVTHSSPGDGWWLLAVASRLPVLARRDLPIGAVHGDPVGLRSVLALTIDVGGTPVELLAVHTSSKLWYAGPLIHLSGLRRHLPALDTHAIVAGDCNLWGPGVVTMLRGWRRAVRGRTFTSRTPHSQIDHILVSRPIEVLSGEVLAPTLSDHRPIRTRLRIA
jgi:endonuclease/exonuclease/phosphatase family metal-dependent hydrolase